MDKDIYKDWADKYDTESVKCQWHGPDILFGMMYLHVNSGESLLDVGIGTGLCALPFYKAGLEIHGMDSSPAMIEKCRKRGFPFELTQRDLQEIPWPFTDNSFNHVISTGLTHFISDLRAMITESARVMKSGGLFGFDYYPYDPADVDDSSVLKDGIYECYDAEYNQRYYRHTDDYIRGLLSKAGFSLIAEAEFLASKETKRYFKTVISRL